MDARGIDTDPGWENRRFTRIERMIEALRSERRAAATTIADGGSLLVRGLLRIAGSLDLTGTLSMKSEGGDEIVRMGDMTYGDRGLRVGREDGTVALEVSRLSSGVGVGQSVAVYDGGEVRVLEADAFAGGLRRPFFEHPFQPVSATSGTAVTCGPHGWERVTTSTSWETLFVYDGKRQNVYVDLKVAALCSDATTAGEVQVVNLADGQPLPDFFGPVPWKGIVAAGTTTYAVLDPTPTQALLANTAGAMQYVRLGVQVRRTAGAGSITLAIPQSIGG